MKIERGGNRNKARGIILGGKSLDGPGPFRYGTQWVDLFFRARRKIQLIDAKQRRGSKRDIIVP